MRVRFKDYGFFVPTDLPSGSIVRMEGRFDIEETSVEELRHYLMDAGKPDEAAKITEPERTFAFEATGVAIAPVEGGK
jgi:hypothetical protein